MAQQTIQLEAEWFFTSISSIGVAWVPDNSTTTIDAALAPSGAAQRWLQGITFNSEGRVVIDLRSGDGRDNQDLSSEFETNGHIRIIAAGQTLTVALAGADTSEPYTWYPSNSAEVIAFYNALSGLADDSTAATLILSDTPFLFDASAPAVTVNPIPDGEQGTTVQLGVTLSGGTYDTLEYLWADIFTPDDAGGLQEASRFDDFTSATPTWTRPDSPGTVTIICSVTARGTGTNAVDGTSDNAQGQATATVTALPDADAPTGSINAIASGDEDTSVQVSLALSGGTYDSLTYAWSATGGSFDDASAASPTWTRPTVDADGSYTITCIVTATGDGTTTVSGTTDSLTVTASAQVTNVADATPADNQQTMDLPASSFGTFGSGSTAGVQWTLSSGSYIDIIDGLTPGSATRTLRRVQVRASGTFAFWLEEAQDRLSGAFDLTDAFETNGQVRIVAGGQTLTVDLAGADTTEPYSWTPDNTAEVAAFVNAIHNNATGSTAAEFTIADGQIADHPPQELSMSADAGSPTAAMDLTAVAPPPQELSMSAEAGSPSASMNARAIAADVKKLSMSATAGAPEATMNAGAIAAPATRHLAMSAEAGSPTAAMDLTAVAANVMKLSMSADAGSPTAAMDLSTIEPLSLSAEAGAPTAGFNLSVDNPLLLADFVLPGGQDLVMSALISIEHNGGQRVDEILDGDMDFGDTGYAWSGMAVWDSPSRINFFDGDPRSVDSQTLFESGGAYHGGTVYVQDEAGVESTAVADIDPSNIGAGGINVLTTVNQAFYDRVAALSDGDRLIIAYTLPSAIVPEALSMSADAGTPEASLNLSTIEPLSMEADAGSPTASLNATTVAPTVHKLSMSATAGAPEATLDARAIAAPATRHLAMSAEAGSPTAAMNATTLAAGELEKLAMSADAGSPTAGFNASVIAPSNQQGILLPAENFRAVDGSYIRWQGLAVAIDGDLTPGFARYFTLIQLRVADGGVILHFNTSTSLTDQRADLSDAFEQNGYLRLTVGEQSLTVALDGADTIDPYIWIPDNSAEVAAFATALDGNANGSTEGLLVLSDGPIADHPPQELSMEADAGTPEAVFRLGYIPPPPQELSMEADAGTPEATMNARAIAAPSTRHLSMSADAGSSPAVTMNARAVAAGATRKLAMSASAGLSTSAYMNLRAIPAPATQALAMEADAGSPSASMNATALAAGAVQKLAFEADAGSSPSASMSARVVPPGAPQQLTMLARTGAPSAEMNLTAIDAENQRLAMEADAGAPEAGMNLTAIEPIVHKLSMRGQAGYPDVRMNLKLPADRLASLSMDAESGGAIVSMRLRNVAVDAPDAPSNLAVAESNLHDLLITWTAPDDKGTPITHYEIRIDDESWLNTRSPDTEFRLMGLMPGRAYQITVRATNANGTGAASAALTAHTAPLSPPSLARHLRAGNTGRTLVTLSWTPPADNGGSDIDHYEVIVYTSTGDVLFSVPTPDDEPTITIKGLAAGHRYGFRVRAVTGAGGGELSDLVLAIPADPITPQVSVGVALPVLPIDRQSFIVRLGNQDCRIDLWWQPSDQAWYASMEVPVNTPVVKGRRLARDSGLISQPDILPGNVYCRGLSPQAGEPGADAWSANTHALVWTADQA